MFVLIYDNILSETENYMIPMIRLIRESEMILFKDRDNSINTTELFIKGNAY